MNTTTSTPNAPVRQGQPTRRIRFVRDLFFWGPGFLITTPATKPDRPDQVDAYFLREIVVRGPGVSFRLAKAGGDGFVSKPTTADTYTVIISTTAANGKGACSCPGWLAHGHCKHLEGLQAFVNAQQSLKDLEGLTNL